MNARTLLSILLLAAGTLFTSSTALAEETKTYQVDPVHSNVLFRVKHADTGYVYGEFLKFEGTVDYDKGEPSNSSIAWTLKADSIFTNHRKRDKHLKSPDFFSAKQYPEITFESTGVEETDDGLRVTGKLTMLGESRELTTEVERTGSGKDKQGNHRIGFSTEFSIDRSDWGMDFMVGGVSDRVDLTLTTEVVAK